MLILVARIKYVFSLFNFNLTVAFYLANIVKYVARHIE